MRSMVKWLALSSASLLAACGGGTGVQTVGGSAPPTGGTSTPTPTHSFVAPTEAKTYEAIGAVQHYEYTTRSDGKPLPLAPGQVALAQRDQLYAGDANTVRNSGISVTYDPRDAIFDITINRPLGEVSVASQRFQDPAHRTDFGGAREPQAGVPDITGKGIQYLQSGTSTGDTGGGGYANGYSTQSDYIVGSKGHTSTISTFFYQKPGTTTSYVTYAGYVRNSISATEQQDDPADPLYLRETYSFDRAAFVYGERTANSAVPTTGTGTYTGDMLATMVYNPQFDTDTTYPTYFQWIVGNSTTTVNFASLGVTTLVEGTVKDPTLDAYTSGAFMLPNGTSFSAYATSTLDLVNKGGFTGSFSCAGFGGSCKPGTSTPVTTPLTIAGSSIDGAFFGPNAQEVGGGFRIVGGKPDERIDILGAFTGKK